MIKIQNLYGGTGTFIPLFLQRDRELSPNNKFPAILTHKSSLLAFYQHITSSFSLARIERPICMIVLIFQDVWITQHPNGYCLYKRVPSVVFRCDSSKISQSSEDNQSSRVVFVAVKQNCSIFYAKFGTRNDRMLKYQYPSQIKQ